MLNGEPSETTSDEAKTEAVLNLFDTSVRTLSVGLASADIKRYPCRIEKNPKNSSSGGHLDVQGGTTVIFIPEGLNSEKADTTFVEEMVHAVHISVNDHLRKMYIQTTELQTDVRPFSQMDDDQLLVAKILLDSGRTSEIISDVVERARLIGVDFNFDPKDYFLNGYLDDEKYYSYSQETQLKWTRTIPGVLLRLYEDTVGQDELLAKVATLLQRYYQSHMNSELDDYLKRDALYSEVVGSPDYRNLKHRIEEKFNSLDEKQILEVTTRVGCESMFAIGTMEAVGKGVDKLSLDKSRQAVKRILANFPQRIDLEVLASNLQIHVYRGDYYPSFGSKVPDEMRLSDKEIVEKIEETLTEDGVSERFLHGALSQYLLFRQRQRVGETMLRDINALRYNDYPEGQEEASLYYSKEYQQMIREMMAQFEQPRWTKCLGKVHHDVPSVEDKPGQVYQGAEMRELTVDLMKARALSRQGNYEYQNNAKGLDKWGWEAVQDMYNFLYLSSPDREVDQPTVTARINDILTKRTNIKAAHAEINMMTELVAKLIAQLTNGGNADSVEIASDLFENGYSWILTASDEANLSGRSQLLRKLESIIRRKDKATLRRFLLAGSFAEQMTALGFAAELPSLAT